MGHGMAPVGEVVPILHNLFEQMPKHACRVVLHTWKCSHRDSMAAVQDMARTTYQRDPGSRPSLWAHVHLINPTAAAQKGYWWTNVQMPFTT